MVRQFCETPNLTGRNHDASISRSVALVSAPPLLMNTLKTLTLILASLFLVSADVPDLPLGKAPLVLYTMLDQVVGTQAESPQAVTKIFKKNDLRQCLTFTANPHSYQWYLDLLARTKRSDVAQIMMNNAVAVMDGGYGEFYANAVREKMKFLNYDVVPGSQDHKTLISWVANWSSFLDPAKPRSRHALYHVLKMLQGRGNVEVLKSFVEFGTGVPRTISHMSQIDYCDKVKLVIFLFQHPEPTQGLVLDQKDENPHGYTPHNSPDLLKELFSHPNFTPELFESAVKEGFVNGSICFNMAVHVGRDDLVYMAYRLGFRPMSCTSGVAPTFSVEVLENLVNRLVFKRYKEMMVAISDPSSPIYGITKDVVVAITRKLRDEMLTPLINQKEVVVKEMTNDERYLLGWMKFRGGFGDDSILPIKCMEEYKAVW